LDKGAIPFGAILGNYIKINGIRFLGGRIFPLISLKNPVESGVWCAEAPGIKGLVGVGGVHSTQNAIGAQTTVFTHWRHSCPISPISGRSLTP
jgi:hypothetical protein